jgi:hypothetical protein
MIKVKYNSETTLVEGNFPDNINYPNNDIDTVNKTIDGEPYIEIEADQQVFGVTMCVVDGVYQEFVPTPEVQLQEAKDSKIAQMKINRDDNINKDYVSSQGNELIYNSSTGLWDIGQSFYFHFSVKLTDSTATNPEVVLRAAKESDITYSCDIIDDSVDGGIRKGYINLTAALSDDVGVHVRNRTQDSIIWANNLEIEINACTTIEEVEAVDINFNNIN